MIILHVLAGIVLANFYEWFIHRYLLHGIGRLKDSVWNFHWGAHHKITRQNNGHDSTYIKGCYRLEKYGLLALFLAHVPFLYPHYVILSTLAIYGILYYKIHSYSHLNPAWCKKHLRWHWDHHMGKDQDANWCILFPLFDYILRTRVKT